MISAVFDPATIAEAPGEDGWRGFVTMANLASSAWLMSFAHRRESAPVQPRLYFRHLHPDVNIGIARTFDWGNILPDESFNQSKLLMLLT